jgi:hypothetical protein
MLAFFSFYFVLVLVSVFWDALPPFAPADPLDRSEEII